ncbi:hypothetical protein LCGC14_0235500 [marine sediment metagenome]|uniref:N-acylneuraminate cytidylyltransferase n=1 Tax=marine sediment metagenome TaxID=412755 RepID=A0A0F9UDF9_9ZZZZ
MKTIALVAAKGTSKRVESKSIRPFAGMNLTTLKLQTLLKVKHLDGIVLSSEDPAVLNKAAQFRILQHKRDVYFSLDTTPMSEVYQHLANAVMKNFGNDTVIVWTPITNPLILPKSFDEVIETYYDRVANSQHKTFNYDCLHTVTRIHDYIFDGWNRKPTTFTSFAGTRSNQIHAFKLNLGACILPASKMRKCKSILGETPYFEFVDRNEFMDIDYPEEFAFAEMLYRSREKSKPMPKPTAKKETK